MKAAKTGMSASYLYDPLGRRTTKTMGGTVTNFLHDGDTEIGEYEGSGNIQRRFVRGPEIDQPIAMINCTVPGNSYAGSNAAKTMFHYDKLGSVVAMSNAGNGQLATNGGPFLYDAFGNCTSGGAPYSTAGTPYLYTGQRFDPETGLYLYRARCYSPWLDRFCQPDPVGYAVDVNGYSYTGNHPTDATDQALFQSTPHGSVLFDNSCPRSFIAYKLADNFSAEPGMAEAIADRQRKKTFAGFRDRDSGCLSIGTSWSMF
jgi:RHS repeat-associated protein